MNTNLFEEPAPGAGEWLTAHCDGGSRGNPGPSAYGAVIEDAQGHEVARLSRFLGRQTNNFAEYSGLVAVLEWALEHGHKRLRVVSDSELMVKQMKGQYKVASPALRPLWEEAKRLSRQLEGFEIRHTLRAGNALADKLANEAMDRGTGKTRVEGQGPRGPGTEGLGTKGLAPRVEGSGIRDQGPRVQRSGFSVQGAAPAARDQRSENRDQKSSGGMKEPKLVLDGYVKGGVVHLLEGELPEGVFVKVIKE
jgi:ribonuclease HI